jgi:hypothetical protein
VPTGETIRSGGVQVVPKAPEVGVAFDVGPERSAGQTVAATVVDFEEDRDASGHEHEEQGCNDFGHGSKFA